MNSFFLFKSSLSHHLRSFSHVDGGVFGLRGAVLRGVGGVDEDAGGIGREVLARDEFGAEIAGFDPHELVRLRVVMIRRAGERHVDFEVLGVHGGRDRALAVGTVHAVGRVEDFGERGCVEFAGLVVADGLAFRERLHEGHAAGLGGGGERDGLGLRVDFRGRGGFLREAEDCGGDGHDGRGEKEQMFHGMVSLLREGGVEKRTQKQFSEAGNVFPFTSAM